MRIHGLRKMTLLDYPGHVACTVFLGGCDFRCPFCHNFQLAAGPFPEVIPEEDFLAFLDSRRGLLDGVAVSGGEPCLRADLPEFLEQIRRRGFAVKLDTNGYHPRMLADVLGRGLLDYVAMDIKNAPGKYARTAGLPEVDLARIDASRNLLMRGDVPHEFRTTVVQGLHEAADFEEIGRWIQGARLYVLQAFEDRDAVPDHSLSAPSPEAMRAFRAVAARYVQEAIIRGE